MLSSHSLLSISGQFSARHFSAGRFSATVLAQLRFSARPFWMQGRFSAAYVSSEK
jgi:hypothetical protein